MVHKKMIIIQVFSSDVIILLFLDKPVFSRYTYFTTKEYVCAKSIVCVMYGR